MLSYGQSGLPLQIFHRKCKFIPIFSLNELEIFDKCTGFVAGTTNSLFLDFPKAKADIVINIDKDTIVYQPKEEKLQTPKLKAAKNHTLFERNFCQ